MKCTWEQIKILLKTLQEHLVALRTKPQFLTWAKALEDTNPDTSSLPCPPCPRSPSPPGLSPLCPTLQVRACLKGFRKPSSRPGTLLQIFACLSSSLQILSCHPAWPLGLKELHPPPLLTWCPVSSHCLTRSAYCSWRFIIYVTSSFFIVYVPH